MASEQAEKRARTEALAVVLGSSSKWRRNVFREHFPEYGCDFMSPDIDEKAIRAERPEDMTLAIARAKADALVAKLAGREVLLICMDQVITCDGVVREKPENAEEARRFLESYREGKGATVVNGLVVHNTRSGRRVSANNLAEVFWKPFPDSVIEHLLDKKEIMTCAGGFVVEDEQLSKFVDRLEGTLDAVQGLPVQPLRELLLRVVAPAPTHVIFDMDGLLLDTETSYTVAQQEILNRWGRKFTWTLKARMMGKKATEGAQWLIDELGLHEEVTAEQFVEERSKRLEVLFANAELMPGAERLVRHLHRSGVPMAVATGSDRQTFELKTTLHRDFFGLFHHIVTGDQVVKGKPDPEIFQQAAGLFGGNAPSPETILIFEDAPNGVEAARAAGMQVCHVPDANLGADFRGRSHGEIRSLEDFRPDEWGLPNF